MGLTAYPFSVALLPLVQGFHCGNEPWVQDVAAWIKGTQGDCALAWMQDPKCPCEVWIYIDNTDRLVGYGSLGMTTWNLPEGGKVERRPVQIIPYFGVEYTMRGVPKDHPEERPSHIIFDDLIARAIDQADKTSMNLGLYVDKRNLAAIKFYKKFGLYEIPMPRKNGDPSLMAMLCNLITEVRRLHP